jgi:hypothetical protein
MILTLLTTTALSAAIAIPVLGAGPTYSGPVTCEDPASGETKDVETLLNDTKHEIAAYRKFLTSSDQCANGSVDTSALTKD